MGNSEIVVTAAQMKEIEQKADKSGLSYYQMMENAGSAAYEIIKERFPEAESFVVFAGKGNNAGDGFVLSRLAAKEAKTVKVILAEGEPKTEDAITNFALLKDLPVQVVSLDEVNEPVCADIIVDAIYGTGFHGRLRPEGEKACALINSADSAVISLDVPSGVNCDCGTAAKGAVRALLTISFHAFKPVHVSEAAKEYCGESVLADIGINGQQ